MDILSGVAGGDEDLEKDDEGDQKNFREIADAEKNDDERQQHHVRHRVKKVDKG